MQRAHQARALLASPSLKFKSPNLSAIREARCPLGGNRAQTRWRSYRASVRPALVPIRSDMSARRMRMSVTVWGRIKPADSLDRAISNTSSRKWRVVSRRLSTGAVSSREVTLFEGGLSCLRVPGDVQWCSNHALRMPNLAMKPREGSVPPAVD